MLNYAILNTLNQYMFISKGLPYLGGGEKKEVEDEAFGGEEGGKKKV